MKMGTLKSGTTGTRDVEVLNALVQICNWNPGCAGCGKATNILLQHTKEHGMRGLREVQLQRVSSIDSGFGLN